VLKIRRNINLGTAVNRSDNPSAMDKYGHDRIRSIKNGKKAYCRILHIIVYVGFVVINIELLEINH
jgi:hypothetical protein